MKPKQYIKLIIGAIYSDIELLDSAKAQILDLKLIINSQSKEYPFDLTKYYNSEMGPNLKRCFLTIKGLQNIEESYTWKLKMIKIENNLSHHGKRRINLDPGYVDTQKIILFSKKSGPQKVYIRKGIWGDLVLIKQKNGFQYFPWTFPDIREGRYNNFFLEAIKEFKEERKKFKYI